MPWNIVEGWDGCEGYAVVNAVNSKSQGCHGTYEEAEAQLRALYANEPEAQQGQKMENETDVNKQWEGSAFSHKSHGEWREPSWFGYVGGYNSNDPTGS